MYKNVDFNGFLRWMTYLRLKICGFDTITQNVFSLTQILIDGF